MAAKRSQELIKSAIADARRAEKITPDRKKETYLAVLLANLLQPSEVIAVGAAAETAAQPRGKRQVIGELFSEKRPGSEVEKVVTAGYYLESVEGLSGFNVDDLQRCFVQAKERRPRNLNDAIYKGIRKGFVVELPEKKEGKKTWQLTRTGEEVVQRGFKSL